MRFSASEFSVKYFTAMAIVQFSVRAMLLNHEF